MYREKKNLSQSLLYNMHKNKFVNDYRSKCKSSKCETFGGKCRRILLLPVVRQCFLRSQKAINVKEKSII